MSKLKDILMIVRHTNQIDKILKDDKYLSNRLEAEIMRNVHSIETGLSLVHPRKLFGLEKISTMLDQVDRYVKLSCINMNIIHMVVDALKAYLQFHSDEEYLELNYIKDKVSKYIEQFAVSETPVRGGCNISPFNVAMMII